MGTQRDEPSVDTVTGRRESRRERQRRELTSEIVAIARRQLAEGGLAAVSWRGIAREIGMNPASLYTYFEGIDDLFTAMLVESFVALDLFTAMLVESFVALGDAVSAARTSAIGDGAKGAEQLKATAEAYRRWAVDHPGDFDLIFADQIPGYEAPPGGPTVTAQTHVLRPFIESLNELLGTDYSPSDSASVPREVMARFVGLWSAIHGLVMLEINNHLPFVDDPESILIAEVDRIVRSLTD